MLKQYKEAIEKSNIISKTDVSGIITFVNDEFCKISGYTKDELIGKNHNIVRHPDVLKSTFKSLWDTIKAKNIYKGTVKNKAKDGSTFYVNTTVIPILDKNDDVEEFIKSAVKLYTDEESWKEAQKNGTTLLHNLYDSQTLGSKLIENILNVEENLTKHRLNNFTGAMLKHHSMMSTKYMSQWIAEKNKTS